MQSGGFAAIITRYIVFKTQRPQGPSHKAAQQPCLKICLISNAI